MRRNSLDSEAILEKNKSLKNLHAGKRCFIIGNGPSVKDQDIRLLQNDVKLCVNQFYHHPLFKEVPPDFWVQADPLICQKKDQYLQPLLDAIESNQVVTKLFFPLQCRVRTEGSTFLDIFYFKYDYAHKGICRKIDFCGEIPPYGENVLLVCLMLAFYLGCSPIYILGAEHSWWSWQKDGYRDRQTPHFYDSRSMPASDRYSYEYIQTTIFAQKFQYLRLKQYALKNGFSIFNATKGGELEIFDRVDFEELFQRNEAAPTTTGILETLPNAAQSISRAALKLIQNNDFIPALALLDEAMRQNINRQTKIQGLHYLRSLCLSGLGYVHPAITEARLDIRCNPANRENARGLLQALADA